MWTDDLLDMRYVDRGQDLYLRLAESELQPPPPALPPSLPSRSRAPTGPVIGAVGSLVGILLVAFLLLVVIRRRRRRRPSNTAPSTPDGFIQRTTPAPTVPSSELSSLKKATGDFSESNIIGRGGFGIVYEVRTSNYGFSA
jgi:flagellar biosynthesis/type III secretory pathway M-ring protein FliF/YscJ